MKPEKKDVRMNLKKVRRIMKKYGLVATRKGNCIDNAPTESFFGHTKDDIEIGACKTYEEVLLLVSEYMRYCNYERPQWKRKKMTLLNAGIIF